MLHGSRPKVVRNEDVLATSRQLFDVSADDDDDVDYNKAAGMSSHLTTLQPNVDDLSGGVGQEDADEDATNDELCRQNSL